MKKKKEEKIPLIVRLAQLINPELILRLVWTNSKKEIERILKNEGKYQWAMTGMCKEASDALADFLDEQGIDCDVICVNQEPENPCQPKDWWKYPPEEAWAAPHWLVEAYDKDSNTKYWIDVTLCQEENSEEPPEVFTIPYIVIEEKGK